MKSELLYSELDYSPNVKAPEPLKNAGLYTGDVLFDKKPWGNNYVVPRIESYNRPGNNTINSNDYKTYNLPGGDNNYNFSCYVNNVLG